MSNIFNLFGSTTNIPKIQQRNGLSDLLNRRSVKPNIATNGGSSKQGSTPKPKGLSVRSNSDLNVCSPSLKNLMLVKARLNTLNTTLNPVTPRQKEAVEKLQTIREKQVRGLSPTNKSPFFNLTMRHKGSDDLLFKKPVTPKGKDRKRFVYPEPEQIAPYIDDHLHIRNNYSVDNDLEFVRNLSKSQKDIHPWIDEGFESDPEFIPTPPLSPLRKSLDQSPSFDMILDVPEIPSLNDNDSDF